MSKGCLVFAFNNEKINYIKQAEDLAKRVSRYLKLPTTLVTDKFFDSDVFDQVIEIKNDFHFSKKTYHNGNSNERLSFFNAARIKSYDLTPYDQTIILDSDFIVCNNNLNKCFKQKNSVCMYDTSFDICSYRQTDEFTWISDIGCKFYWATCTYFKKDTKAKLFFDTINHVYENYFYYKRLYQINSNLYRNDFSFSIAAHILNNYQKGNFVGNMPDTMYYSLDRDEIISIDDNKFTFLTDFNNKKIAVKTKGQNIHCMNKYSLEKIL